ncbi:DUF4352 domain-containing protein [Paenibacillus sp. FSL R7-0048]|uniref:DUF4352 domain-containing protein n=1 Tax=Paenibacillus odorifer TaxID=189426 RepID=A0ABX3GBV4_9BACL|nr:DUF4352 domain-containing protein [Paenibacillus odorifer]OMC70422.1 hypothetical protein BK125_26480 [Paenibacillus odorifer]OMC90991.1 hypothetical protein BSO21_34495 [Paenibacillus odorifer]OMD12567.1 hypothetical protein BJP47_04935 [Paenibacillus odorifer]OMD25916.1 hypothetical protein BJP48_04950 [Paenibacillus odorifer]OMD74334.1 hypothetical protein BSK48_00460 [Paenibacillus odorifer]
MKKIFKIGCLGFIALIVLIIVIGIFAKDKDSSNDTTSKSNTTANSVETKGTSKEDAKKLAKKGEELQVGDVVFKVNKVTTTKEIKDGNYLSYSPSADGSIFLVVNVTVKNAGKKMITTDSSYFQLLKDEVTYNPSTLITTSGDYFLYEGINPGLAQTGNVVFEIPEDMTGFLLNVQTGFWGTEQGQIELK